MLYFQASDVIAEIFKGYPWLPDVISANWATWVAVVCMICYITLLIRSIRQSKQRQRPMDAKPRKVSAQKGIIEPKTCERN